MMCVVNRFHWPKQLKELVHRPLYNFSTLVSIIDEVDMKQTDQKPLSLT